VRSFAIVTTTPSELRAEVHNRMAMVLGPETWPAAWLGGGIPPTRASSRHTRTLPVGRDDILARQLTRRDDPNRIEPIAVQ